MKKKTPNKIIIAKVRQQKPFDLSFSNARENTKIVVALQSLKMNAGWQFLEQLLRINMKELSESIISKQDYSKKPLTDGEVDVLREKYRYLDELLSKPDEFMNRLSVQNEESGAENLDPYEN